MKNRLLEIRLQHKVKRVFLANVLGTNVSTIYRWEVQQQRIPYEMLLETARFFEIAAIDIVPALAEVQLEEVSHA